MNQAIEKNVRNTLKSSKKHLTLSIFLVSFLTKKHLMFLDAFSIPQFLTKRGLKQGDQL
jgi:hypothetical protein